ncbi:MAG: histidine phosphatase family protein, partial [Phycisphaeraceae bacterium]|nr:histidine phosphatase family protein [Phycisphaeraceae bacterium]
STRTTGASFGDGEPLAEWREFDLGVWDGMRPEEIRRRYPDIQGERFGSGDFQPEGGERFSEFADRVRGAFDTLVARIDDGEEAIAVTHGGVIQTIAGSLIGAVDQSTMLVPSNASLTTIRVSGERAEVFSLNDDLHLEGDAARPSGTRLRFIRHGQTVANLERRWWGKGESPLSDEGRRQALALAQVGGAYDAFASSPSARARDTAVAVAGDGEAVQIVDDLAELNFGEWEGLTGAEARDADPEAFRRIFQEGHDEPRGRTGESFAGAGERFESA